jgi:hypothetical protein
VVGLGMYYLWLGGHICINAENKHQLHRKIPNYLVGKKKYFFAGITIFNGLPPV